MLYVNQGIQLFLHFIRLCSFLHWRDIRISGMTDLVPRQPEHADPGKVTEGAQLWQHRPMTDLRCPTPLSAAERTCYVLVTKGSLFPCIFLRHSLRQRGKKTNQPTKNICWWAWTSTTASRKWRWDYLLAKLQLISVSLLSLKTKINIKNQWSL